MNNLQRFGLIALISASGCAPLHRFNTEDNTRFIPAEVFSKSIKSTPLSDFSVFNDPRTAMAGEARAAEMGTLGGTAAAGAAVITPAVYRQDLNGDLRAEFDKSRAAAPALRPAANQNSYGGEERYLDQGLALRRSITAPGAVTPPQQFAADQRPAFGGQVYPAAAQQPAAMPVPQPLPPPGSSSPYFNGQMTSNPSLWPDESNGSYLFRDFRAYQPMDVITILVDDDTKGKKKADTKSEGKFDLLAGITNFFGIETKNWASNNAGLDPQSLINATTNNKFEGKGETKREGSLTSQLSGVVLEVLPNGVLRLEGSKIVAINDEEEVMVVSGLVRTRDIDANNQVDSSRIANMRIDFYGRGVLADQQAPGWGARLFEYVWPF